MFLVRQLTLFLASPGDCSAERDVVRRVVEELNDSLGKMHEVRVEVVGWDSHARPATGKDSQALINQQIADMKQHELFVGLLWNRFGTPTPRTDSGTQEEFNLAVKARGRRASAKPEIMFYFNEAPVNLTSQREIEQKSLVLKFKESLKRTLYWKFDGTAAFETLFRRHYGDWLIETIANFSQAESSRIQVGENILAVSDLTRFPLLSRRCLRRATEGAVLPKGFARFHCDDSCFFRRQFQPSTRLHPKRICADYRNNVLQASDFSCLRTRRKGDYARDWLDRAKSNSRFVSCHDGCQTHCRKRFAARRFSHSRVLPRWAEVCNRH